MLRIKPRGISLSDQAYLQGQQFQIFRKQIQTQFICLLWLDAADISTFQFSTGISQWADKSGNNNHATQATGASQPTRIIVEGRPAVNFASQFLSIPLAAALTTNTSIYGVWRSSTTGNVSAGLINLTTVGDNPEIRMGIGDNNASYWQGSYQINANIGYTNRSVFVQTFRTVTSIVYTDVCRNGNIIASGNKTSPWSAFTEFTLGRYIRVSGNRDGFIQELIVATGVPSLKTRQRIEGYLAWKWGLQTSLSYDHPYSNRPPFLGDSQ